MKRLLASLAHLTAIVLLAGVTVRLWQNLRFLRFAREQAHMPSVPPRVSVLIPARNEARVINDCVESVARQAYPDFEILILVINRRMKRARSSMRWR